MKVIAVCPDCGKQFEVVSKDIRTFECAIEPFKPLYVQIYECKRCGKFILAQLDTDETMQQLDVVKDFANRMNDARNRRQKYNMQKWSKAGLFANKKLDGMRKNLVEKYKGTIVVLDNKEFEISSVGNIHVEEEGGNQQWQGSM